MLEPSKSVQGIKTFRSLDERFSIIDNNNNVPEIFNIQSPHEQPSASIIYFDDYHQLYDGNYNIGSYIKMYCSDEKLLSKIYDSQYEFIKEILEIVLSNFKFYLDETLDPDKYSLECYLWSDVELPDWEQIILKVKSNFDDYEVMDKLWSDLIQKYNESYDSYIIRVPMDETNEEKMFNNLVRIIVEVV